MSLSWIKQTSRSKKRSLMILIDLILLPLALWLSFSLRYGEVYLLNLDNIWLFLMAPLIAIPIFIKMGMYRAVVHLMEVKALWTICKSVTLSMMAWAIIVLLVNPDIIPRSSLLNFWLLSLLFIGGSRMWMRWLLLSYNSVQAIVPKVAVYGAGSAGVQLISALKHSHEFSVVAFIDDSKDLVGHDISGLNVYSFDDLNHLIEEKGINQILIAISAITRSQKRKIVDKLEDYPVEVRILPSFVELSQGDIDLNMIRDISIEDLLGRDAVAPNPKLFETNIANKVVMVTGSGGSIGSELCRQILRNTPSKLILFEQSEFALYQMERELADHDVDVIPILGSVTHQNRVEHVCRSFGVQTIYHAAAYKHVPLVEYNPIEGIQNNIFGTWRTARAAIDTGVETFVLISTDKAVRPTNVMGATKRFSELVLQALAAEDNGTRFCMVRFGNVLGSSGSVVPLFHKQIKQGGPITVTHPEITRYFMTIPEAAQLVIQAGSMGSGGDVFVLDMGDSVKIVDLATKIIGLSGLSVKDEKNPDGDIEIQFTGLRPGEKLYEELLIGDNVTGTDHPLIMRAEEAVLPMQEMERLLSELLVASQHFDVEAVIKLLLQGVEGYQPQCEIKDLAFCHTTSSLPKAKSFVELT